MNKKVFKVIDEYVPFDDEEKAEKEIILDFIKSNEDVLTRDNRHGHFTVSLWVTNKKRNKVLMIHHNIYNAWAWVGGHADGDSDFLHVALKELEEETGIKDVKVLNNSICGVNIITVDHHYKRGKYVPSHLHYDVEYMVECDDKLDLRIKEDENSGVEWISYKDLLNSEIEPKMKPVYEKLMKKSKLI